MLDGLVNRFVPISLYSGNESMLSLADAERPEFEFLSSKLNAIFMDTFIKTATIDGIIKYERILEIKPNPVTESEEFRRQRVINRLQMHQVPFTIRFLRSRLDDIIGVGAYETWIDHDNYTLYIDAITSDYSWFQEVSVMIGIVKPCNIIFNFTPALFADINANEYIELARSQWNYKLNGRWKLGLEPFGWDEATEVTGWNYLLDGRWALGQAPFGVAKELEMIKLSNVSSIKDPFLRDHAQFTADSVASVLINDILPISTFIEKISMGNMSRIRYLVPEDSGITEITNVKLLNAGGEILTSAPVFVPIVDQINISLRHTITHKEGI